MAEGEEPGRKYISETLAVSNKSCLATYICLYVPPYHGQIEYADL